MFTFLAAPPPSGLGSPFPASHLDGEDAATAIAAEDVSAPPVSWQVYKLC
jgi:hypothetical protein